MSAQNKSRSEEDLNEIHQKAEALYEDRLEERLGDLPPGVPISTKKLYLECWDETEAECSQQT